MVGYGSRPGGKSAFNQAGVALDITVHSGTIAKPLQRVEGVNYVTFHVNGSPAVIVVNMQSKVLVVTADDANFNKILEQFGVTARKDNA